MFKRIVVPLDGSPFGDHALRHATVIATAAGAAIELVHVHTPESFDGQPETVTAFRYQDVIAFEAATDASALRDDGERLAARARRIQLDAGVPVTSRVLAGRVGPALEREAENFDADLIVMATHARGGLDRLRLGSIGDTVARIATMPILFVRPPDDDRHVRPPMFRDILVPLDGSGFSEHIVEPAIALARLFGARLSVFHLPHAAPRLRFTSRARAEAEFDRAAAGAEYLQDIVGRIAARFSNVDGALVPRGQPASAILDAAALRDSDVVAMATHGRGGASRLVFGSTTDAVMRASYRPVLVVRPRVVPTHRHVAVPIHA